MLAGLATLLLGLVRDGVLGVCERREEAVEEVADGRRKTHHLHALDVRAEDVLGAARHQFECTNTLRT